MINRSTTSDKEIDSLLLTRLFAACAMAVLRMHGTELALRAVASNLRTGSTEESTIGMHGIKYLLVGLEIQSEPRELKQCIDCIPWDRHGHSFRRRSKLCGIW